MYLKPTFTFSVDLRPQVHSIGPLVSSRFLLKENQFMGLFFTVKSWNLSVVLLARWGLSALWAVYWSINHQLLWRPLWLLWQQKAGRRFPSSGFWVWSWKVLETSRNSTDHGQVRSKGFQFEPFSELKGLFLIDKAPTVSQIWILCILM